MNRLANRQQLMAYCLASALPLLVVALVFNFPLLFSGSFLPGAGLDVLGHIMQAEFLAASSGILVVLPLLFPARARWLRWVRFAIFAVFGYAFASVAYVLDGTAGMLYYSLLVFLTYGGGMLFVFDWLSCVTRAFLSLLRWSVAIFAYVTLQLQFDLDVDIRLWTNTRAVVPFGALFFYALVVCEVFIYPLLTWYLETSVRQEKRLQLLEAGAAGAEG